MKKALTVIFFTLIVLTGSGQAIRINLYSISSFSNEFGSSFYFGLGYEQNITERISATLETNIGAPLSYNNYEDVHFSENGIDYQGRYEMLPYWFEIAYQSKYFLRDNDEGSFYVASGLTWRKFTIETDETIYETANYYGAPTYKTYKQNITLIPLSLKFGYRSSLRAFVLDMSIGLNYIPGASSKEVDVPYLGDALNDQLFKSLSLSYCFAIGFGWDRD